MDLHSKIDVDFSGFELLSSVKRLGVNGAGEGPLTAGGLSLIFDSLIRKRGTYPFEVDRPVMACGC